MIPDRYMEVGCAKIRDRNIGLNLGNAQGIEDAAYKDRRDALWNFGKDKYASIFVFAMNHWYHVRCLP